MQNNKIEKLISLFFSTGRLIRERSQKDVEFDPISMMKLETLRFISSTHPTMKDVAQFLRVKAPTATSIVGGFVKKGDVIREPDKNDRRTVKLKITKKGISTIEEGMKKASKQLGGVLSKLKEEHVDNFIEIMEEIKNEYK